jgi:FAD dependent oxidoreductase
VLWPTIYGVGIRLIFHAIIFLNISLQYLLKRFLAKGGEIVRATVQHLSQVLDGAFSSRPGQPPSAVFVCLGLGAYSLGGLEDKNMYPIRGQTVLLNAPWVKFGRGITTLDDLWTYVIPRRSGDVSYCLAMLCSFASDFADVS